MKILASIVIPPHLRSSGAVNAAIALSTELRAHCEIEVAQMAGENSEQIRNGLPIYYRKTFNALRFTEGILPNRFRTLFYKSDIDHLVEGYDLVHIHNPIPALEMKRIAQACLRKKIPYVLTTHGFVEVLELQKAYRLGWLQSLLGKWLILNPVMEVVRNAAHICCLAPQDQMMLEERGIPKNRTCVIPNGVSRHYFQDPTAVEMRALREKFQLPEKSDATVCFFLANHTRNKGLDILLDAFTQTKTPYLLIVGGRKRDYDYEGYASRAGENQRILFTDSLTDTEIRSLHHYSELFVFPSRADTLPLVILEAMASGRAILSTRVGGIPFQVDSSCGRLVETENPKALREAFEELARDRKHLAAMGAAAKDKVQSEFSWEKSAAMTAQLYRQILGLPHPAPTSSVPLREDHAVGTVNARPRSV